MELYTPEFRKTNPINDGCKSLWVPHFCKAENKIEDNQLKT